MAITQTPGDHGKSAEGFTRLKTSLEPSGLDLGTDQTPIDPIATEALGELPDDQRAALVLRYVDDQPVAEVARLLGRSVSARALSTRPIGRTQTGQPGPWINRTSLGRRSSSP